MFAAHFKPHKVARHQGKIQRGRDPARVTRQNSCVSGDEVITTSEAARLLLVTPLFVAQLVERQTLSVHRTLRQTCYTRLANVIEYKAALAEKAEA